MLLPTQINRGTTVHETGDGPRSTKIYKSKINQTDIQLRRRWGSGPKNMPSSVNSTVQLRGELVAFDCFMKSNNDFVCQGLESTQSTLTNKFSEIIKTIIIE